MFQLFTIWAPPFTTPPMWLWVALWPACFSVFDAHNDIRYNEYMAKNTPQSFRMSKRICERPQ